MAQPLASHTTPTDSQGPLISKQETIAWHRAQACEGRAARRQAKSQLQSLGPGLGRASLSWAPWGQGGRGREEEWVRRKAIA